MAQITVTGGVSTWASSLRPTANFASDAFMRVLNSVRAGFLWLAVRPTRGATITNATLYLTQHTAHSGSATVSVTHTATTWAQQRLNWANRPGATGPSATLTKADSGAGEVWAFDVTAQVQAVANGAPWRGWRISIDAGDNEIQFKGPRALWGKPRLVFNESTAPQKPLNLLPSEGAVSVAKPVVRCDFRDRMGNTHMAAIQVQIDPAANWVAPAFDSGAVLSTEPVLDLADTSFGGVANGDQTFWRVRVKDGDNLWSPWSDAAIIHRVTQGTLTIINPDVDGVVPEYTPPIVWSLAGATQARYRAWIVDPAKPFVALWDTNVTGGGDDSRSIPFGVLCDGRTYRLYVRTWDTVEREATPGAPAYAEAFRDFHVEFDPTVDPPSAIIAERNPDRPGVRLEFTRADMPDSWVIERDGRVIDADVNAPDSLVSGTTYEYVDLTAPYGRTHTYRVRANVTGRLSDGGPTASIDLLGSGGLWLGYLDSDVWVRLSNANLSGLSMQDIAAVHQPINGLKPVRIVSAMYGLSGGISGILSDRSDGYHRTDGLDALREIKENPTRRARLVGAELSIPVTVGDITWRPHEDTSNRNRRTYVEFTVIQQDEFDFQANL